LFVNQLELVKDLISLEGSPYQTLASDVEKHRKEFARLKTYISQLLSSTVSRSVTEDFKEGLLLAVKKRLTDKKEANKLVNTIIADLKSKNARISKPEHRSAPFDQFLVDLQSATYVAVITMRPLQLDMPKADVFSIRHLLFKDIIDRLVDSDKDLRQYRFNFPTDAYSQLFWRGFRRILVEWLEEHLHVSMLESLYGKFTIKIETQERLNTNETFNRQDCIALADEILRSLNHNRYLRVFTSSAPIFSLPMVILDPTEPTNIKVYTVFENEKRSPAVFKYPVAELSLWRIFMWDQFKLQRNLTQEKKFADAI
jgi:hypothetical protein